MKYLISLLLVVTLFACKNTGDQNSEEISEEKTTYTLKKEVNNEFEDPEDGGMMLLGSINRKGLETAPYNEWFTENKASHTLDTVVLDSITPLLNNVKIKVFMGTWCEDSQREVPALYKILDAAGYDYSNFNTVAVSHDKETPNGLEKGHHIDYVPTIIFTKNGDTLNRIVEYAHQTLEKDILTILQEKPYSPAYSE